MIWVEFTGLVGSGKSTLADRVKQRLINLGYRAYDPQEALQASMDQDPFVNAARRLPHSREMYQRWTMAHSGIQFAFRHPRLVWHIYQSGHIRSHLAPDHQRRILRFFFKVAGWYWWLGNQLGDGSYVIADEGFFHRAINLFAWADRPLPAARIQQYFQHIPDLDLVVRVNAPVEVCLERAIQRGLPVYLLSRNPATVTQFMQNSEEILNAAVQELRGKKKRVVDVWNISDLRAAEDQIVLALAQSGILASHDNTMSSVTAAGI
jgi:adenylate kinase family enzyme